MFDRFSEDPYTIHRPVRSTRLSFAAPRTDPSCELIAPTRERRLAPPCRAFAACPSGLPLQLKALPIT
jgi:hypothetical protein